MNQLRVEQQNEQMQTKPIRLYMTVGDAVAAVSTCKSPAARGQAMSPAGM